MLNTKSDAATVNLEKAQDFVILKMRGNRDRLCPLKFYYGNVFLDLLKN